MRWRFDNLEIDDEHFSLLRNGKPVAVQPRVLETILYLARHAGRVVDHQELIEQVWAGTIVSDAAVSRAIRKARAALGPEHEGLIATVHGRGYRFASPPVANAHVEPATSPDDSHPRAAQDALANSDATTPSLFGRGEECARMLDCLSAARAGQGATLVVSGSRGIGKSYLLRHWMTLAREAGALVLSGAGDDLEGALPYWPWATVTRELLLHLGPDTRALEQTLQQILPEYPEQPRLHDSQQRFRLFDSYARVLEAVSRKQPTFICMDDMDHADVPSKALVQILAKRISAMRVVLVISVTDDSTPSSMLSQLGHQALHLPLLGLSANEIGQLLETEGVNPSSAKAIYEHCGGNPLYARQLAPLWQRGRRDSLLPLPISLQQAVSTTLRQLPTDLAALISSASVIGDTFAPALLATAMDRPVEEIVADLQRALDLGLVQRTARPVGHFKLQHGLLREVAYQALSPEQRTTMHERVLEMLLAQQSNGEPTRCDVLAFHGLHATVASRLRHGLEFGLQAADQAFRLGAFDRCASHCSRLLETMALSDKSFPEKRLVELRLASALGRMGRLDEASTTYAAAMRDTSRQTPHPPLADSDLRALLSSFQPLSNKFPEVVATMYELLFAAHPETRSMFSQRRPGVQSRMVADTLTAILEHFEDPPWLEETLFALGARHLEYGVEEDMYTWVGDALLAALNQHVGEAFTPQLARIWRRAYDEICRLMLEAGRVSQSVAIASLLPPQPTSVM